MSPPVHLEKVFGWLLPRACREHVLGDLHERYESPRQYVIEGLSVLAPVIGSRIRRTTDGNVLLMEIFALYASFVAAALCLRQKEFLYEHAGFARVAIPTAIATMGLLFSNAYSRRPRPLMASTSSLALAFFGQAAIFGLYPASAVPFNVMLVGSCMSILFVSALRMLFPPITGQKVG